MVPHINEDAIRNKSADEPMINRRRAIAREQHKPLRAVLVGLVLDLLDLDLHSVLGEDHMLALHLLARVLADILHDAVDDVADDGEDGHEDQEEDEGDEIARAHVGIGGIDQ